MHGECIVECTTERYLRLLLYAIQFHPFRSSPIAQGSDGADFTTTETTLELQQWSKNGAKKINRSRGKQWRNGDDSEDTRERADEMTRAETNQNQMYSHLTLTPGSEREGGKKKKRRKETTSVTGLLLTLHV